MVHSCVVLPDTGDVLPGRRSVLLSGGVLDWYDRGTKSEGRKCDTLLCKDENSESQIP